jgi:hypothetical protein
MMLDMAQVRRRDGKRAVLCVLASAALGCGSGSARTIDAGRLPAGEKLQCAAPACCLPVDIDPSKLTVYQSGSDIGIDIILDLPAASADAWNASVGAVLSWGPSVTCTTSIADYAQSFVALTCPAVPTSGAPPCGASATLTLRPSTSTYADATGSQVLCGGKAAAPVEIPVTLTCPSCPALSESSLFQPCDFPQATCNYWATTSSGGTTQLPCTCDVNGVYGDRRWSCMVP